MYARSPSTVPSSGPVAPAIGRPAVVEAAFERDDGAGQAVRDEQVRPVVGEPTRTAVERHGRHDGIRDGVDPPHRTIDLVDDPDGIIDDGQAGP